MKLGVTRFLIPLLLVFCGAMSCERNQVLPPEAPPAPAPIVKVPVPVPLPAGMTDPCTRPGPRSIPTDADLLNGADAWKVTALCNERKLQSIEDVQPKPDLLP